MGKGDKQRPGKDFGEGYDRIFGESHKAKTSRVFVDSRSGKTVEVFERPIQNGQVLIVGDIEPFTSPITRKTIHSRSELREHNKEHGVTDSRDYSPEWRKKAETERAQRFYGQTPQDKKHRIESLIKAVDSQQKKRR